MAGYESWIDRQIREAQERGEFDNLRGSGQPLKGLDGRQDENWWIKGLLERENGRAGAALAAFERAASAKAEAFEGPFLLAETLASLGRREEAERWALEAMRRSPNERRTEQLLRGIRRSGSSGR